MTTKDTITLVKHVPGDLVTLAAGVRMWQAPGNQKEGGRALGWSRGKRHGIVIAYVRTYRSWWACIMSSVSGQVGWTNRLKSIGDGWV